jgi:glucokinase
MKSLHCFAGVDLGGTNIKAGIVDAKGKVLSKDEITTEAGGGVTHVLERIAKCVEDLAKKTRQPVKGVGIGVPGQVDWDKGVVVEAPNLPGWVRVDVRGLLGKRLKLPVFVDNDANAATLAEYAFGSGKGSRDVFLTTLGTGVGGGLVLDGKVYRGVRGGAGEFGHMTIRIDGPECGCGRRGCVEAYVGTRGILRSIQEKLDEGMPSLLARIPPTKRTPKDVFDAAEKGDVVAREVFRDVGYMLGVGFGNVANLLNVEKIVVGGGVARAGHWILDPAREALARTALALSASSVTVVQGNLGSDAGFIGAACLAMGDGTEKPAKKS